MGSVIGAELLQQVGVADVHQSSVAVAQAQVALLRRLHGQGVPDLLLGLLIRHGGTRLQRQRRTAGGLVLSLLGSDALLDLLGGISGGAGRSRQRDDDRPAQILVHVEARDRLGAVASLTQQRTQHLRRLGRVHAPHERADESQLGRAAGLARSSQEGLPQLRPALVRPLRVGVVRSRRARLGQDLLQHCQLGFLGSAPGDQADEVAGPHLRVARHLPGRGPHQGARHRVGDARDVRHAGSGRVVVGSYVGSVATCATNRRSQGPLVQRHIAVGQVVVVDQHQVASGHAHQLGNLGSLAGNIQFHALGALQRAAFVTGAVTTVEAVHAHGNAVGARFARAGLRTRLLHGEGTIGTVRRLEHRGQRIDARRAQPLIRPVRQVAARGFLQRTQQVRERSVAPGVCGEVCADAREEFLQPHVGRQLLQHARALGVGDAVEVRLHRLDIARVREHRVGGGQLVLRIRPCLLLAVERHPCRVVLRRPRLAHGRRPGGEGFVQPQVVPPLHRHQVAEPHVRQLVQDRVRAAFVLVVAGCGAEDVLVPDRHRTRVLHGTHVVFGAEDLVVLVERVADAELIRVVVEALLGYLEQLVGIQVLRQRLAAIQRQRHAHFATGLQVLAQRIVGQRFRGLGVLGNRAAPFVAHHVPRAYAERNEVGRQQVVHGRTVLFLIDARSLRHGNLIVRHHGPLGGRGELNVISRLDVRLVEAGKDPLGVRRLELGVHVGLVIAGIEEAVQTLTRGGVRNLRLHQQLVLATRQVVQRNARSGVISKVPKCRAIELHPQQRVRAQIQESRPGAGREGDAGQRAEELVVGLFAAGKIQLDGVVNIANEVGAMLSLGTG